MQRISLPYFDDSSQLFNHLVDFDYPVFLDSGLASDHRGRYDILSAYPDYRIVADESGARILSKTNETLATDNCAFDLLERWLLKTGFAPEDQPAMPFNGGVIGYLSYDLGRSLENLPSTAVDDINLPWMQMGFYAWAIIVDHHDEQCFLVFPESDKSTFYRTLSNKIKNTSSNPITTENFVLETPFNSNIDKTNYTNKFTQIIDYINNGDCYQVNLAQRFSTQYRGSLWQAYQALRKIAPTPFSAYLGFEQSAVLSLSPERFIQVKNSVVETRPIKGTRPRGNTELADTELKNDLSNSLKDRAENLMIVDLLRNDMGKTCMTGSVKVDQLFTIESYPNVHHLVSVISGKLQEPIEVVKLLKRCFPGGSITGAPKVRSMEIIEELEPHRRSVYCGAIGYIANNGNMDTNISIRTLVANAGHLHCWAGGGIVADSEADREYQETFDKVSNLTSCLEQHFLDDSNQ